VARLADLEDLYVIVPRLTLDDHSLISLDHSLGKQCREREQRQEQDRGQGNTPLLAAQRQPEQRDGKQQQRKEQKRSRRTNSRDRDQHRAKRPQDAAHRGDGIDAPCAAACRADLLGRQANGKRRDTAQQDHRRRKQHQHGQERAPDLDGIRRRYRDERARKGALRQTQDRRGDQRHQPYQECGDCSDRVQGLVTRAAVGPPSTQIRAQREIDQDQADQVGPDQDRVAKVRPKQARSSHLDGHRRHAADKHDQEQGPHSPLGLATRQKGLSITQ
jgi:hypothetical protein